MTAPNFSFLDEQPVQKDATNVVNSQVAKPFIDPTPIEKARWELAHKGITDTQRALAYKGKISDAFYQQLEPHSYDYHGLEILKALGQAITSKSIPDTVPDRVKINNQFQQAETKLNPDNANMLNRREDAWRLYLGLPQKSGTFDISNFKPENSQDQKPYFKIKGFFPTNNSKFTRDFYKNTVALANTTGKNSYLAEDSQFDVMGKFKLSKGEDKVGHYISYYDKWDLDKSGAELAGHPYEIYDRIYYDPKTYAPIPEAQVLAKLKATK